jgi:hypothetical protein
MKHNLNTKKQAVLVAVFLLLGSCSSRSLKPNYTVTNASEQDIPEWILDLNEWQEDEEDDYKKNKYYTYTTETKSSHSIACEIAKAKSATNVAAEISTFIKHSFASSKHGDPSGENGAVSEYIQEDLLKVVSANISGLGYIKSYWEEREFKKEEGKQTARKGYTCSSLVKITKENLKLAFKMAKEKLALKTQVDTKAKARVEKIMEEASKSYTN